MKTIEYILSQNGKIVLILHLNPDPDCIGSALALYQVLKKFNKDVIIISKDELPETVNFLKDFDKIIVSNEVPKAQLYILIDHSEVDRSGFDIKGNILKIDHHISDVVYSEYDFVDPEAPSTTHLILNLIKDFDESLIDENIAECIFIGLMSDTGNFTYSNLKSAFSSALYLANKNFNLVKFSEKYTRNSSINRMRLLQLALSTLKQDGEIAYIIVRSEFYEISGAKRYENYGIVDYPLSLKDIKVALKFEEINKNKWKVNLRSKMGINIQPFAKKYGGGGHENAAAFRIEGTEENIINNVISDLKEYLKIS
ncbi:MAG: bifunctional oligoribonuclease/PAP phosphatase NrnA [candidate division WOR-3 bacterium]|jgi:phosphoesterase RecJ-like protein